MGGILAAEVALLPPHSRESREPFRHRILGTIGFDTPFLGMHPGVVISGIGSLFRPASEKPPEEPLTAPLNVYANAEASTYDPGNSEHNSPSSLTYSVSNTST